MRGVLTVILAGGRGTRLEPLTRDRAKPAVPFGGLYRIIDFTLSNCINSGLRRVLVLTQFKSRSLDRHIRAGWGFLSPELGETVEVLPPQQRIDETWYKGTADAIYQNIYSIEREDADLIMILAGDHIYKMDYARLLADHVRSDADVTVACIEVPIEQAQGFGVVEIEADRRIVRFDEKPAHPHGMAGKPGRVLASMGIYVFGRQFLCDQLARDAADPDSKHDFGRDLLPWLVPRQRVVAHFFADSCVNMVGNVPYWRDVGTVDAFWEANMDLVQVEPELNLYDDQWPILSLQRQLPPAKFVFDSEDRRGGAFDSLVCTGCIVSGATVRRSILFTKVQVGEHSVIEDSLVLPNVSVGRGVRLRRAIVDKHCVLPDGFCAGFSVDDDRRRFHVTDRGVTLITPEMLGQAVRSCG